MAERHARDKVPAVLLKRAMSREDAGEYGTAEADFVADAEREVEGEPGTTGNSSIS